MEFNHSMNRILAIVMCLIMVFTTCAVAEPVSAVDGHQHEIEEVSAENVEAVVEELGEVDLMMDLPAEEELLLDMPEVFEKVEIFDPKVDLDVDINKCGRHMFEADGVCAVCGYECEHSLDEYDTNWEVLYYEGIDNNYHNVYYYETQWCYNCNSYIVVDDTEHEMKQTHANAYECDCGYINENYEEEDGGEDYDCTHPNLKTETIKEPDWEHDKFIVKYDSKTHTYRWIEGINTYCEDCGYWEFEPTGVTGVEATAHSWDSNGTFCNLCPAECKHTDVVTQNSWEGGWDAEYIDENQHKYVYTLRASVRCKTCNKTYGEDTDETIEFVEPHKFVDPDWPHCEGCWYEPEGDVTIEGGSSTPDCTHANVVNQLIYEYAWDADKVDEKGHNALYEAYTSDVCADCGREMDEDKRVRVESEDKIEYEPHTWWVNGDADWWKYGECEYCGYINECAHENALRFEEQVGLTYSDITETTHSSIGVLLDTFICSDCGMTDSSANGKYVVETDEPHYYINGVCPCGTACTHENDFMKWDDVSYDEKTHTIVSHNAEYCIICNMIFNDDTVTVTEDHVLVDEMCEICGFGDIHTIFLPESITLGVKETAVLEMSYLPAKAENTVTFASDKTSVASVDAVTGKVTAKKAGTAVITASTPDGVTATCEVIVKKAPTSVKPSKTKMTLAAGEKGVLGATVSSGSASKITYSSSNKSVATVDASTGEITSVAAGTAKIYVKTFNGKSAYCTLTVKPAPEVVTVTATKAEMSVGQTATLTTKLTTLAGKATTGAYTYSAEPADCATIENGVLTAVKAGTVTVTATAYNGVPGTVTIEVKEAPDKAKVENTEITLGVKETYTLKPTVENGSPADFTYTSDNTAVASVSSAGKITAKKVGTANITVAPHAGEAVTVAVTVKAAPKTVKLSATTKTLGVGEAFKLNATITANSASKLTWKSSKSSIVTVDQEGNLTPVKAGKATITVSTFNGKKATSTVTVKPAPTGITLTASKDTISVGQKVKLTAALNKGAAGAYTYSADPAGIVEFDGNYAVAVGEGDAVITAETYNEKTATASVKVLPAPDKAELAIEGLAITLGVKESFTLKPTIANGSPADFTYTTDKKSVATVSSAGKITGVKAGTANITVAPHAGEPVTVAVTVMAAPKSVKLSATSKTLGVGEEFKLNATLSSKSASKLTWKSSKSSVVAVDQEGNLTAKAAGKATITVSTFNGKKATCTVTVKKAPTGITLKAAKDTLSVGQKVKLTAALSSGAAGSYSYTIEPAGKVEIQSGYAVALEACDTPVTITATTYNDQKASVTLNVLPAPDKAELAVTEVTMGVKETLTLKPTIANGSPADFKYKSDKSSVASVSSSGKITAKKAGKATITVTPHAGEPVTVTVTVKAAATSVKLSSKTMSLSVGDTANLTATVSGGSNKLTWKSSNTAAVTVENGKLTAVAAGKSTITVTTFNGKKATCTVTVDQPVISNAKVGMLCNDSNLMAFSREYMYVTVGSEGKEIEISYKKTENSSELQVAYAQEMIAEGVSVLVLEANDSTAAYEVAKLAKAAGVKIVYAKANPGTEITSDSSSVFVTMTEGAEYDVNEMGKTVATVTLNRLFGSNWFQGVGDNLEASYTCNDGWTVCVA